MFRNRERQKRETSQHFQERSQFLQTERPRTSLSRDRVDNGREDETVHTPSVMAIGNIDVLIDRLEMHYVFMKVNHFQLFIQGQIFQWIFPTFGCAACWHKCFHAMPDGNDGNNRTFMLKYPKHETSHRPQINN